MPWRNPEKPDRVFKDCIEEMIWWDRSIYKLPFRKFRGIDEGVVWGPLYQRFNTVPMPILDMDAWHADVIELMRKSATVEELYKKMEERKQQRLNETVTGIDKMEGDIGWFTLPRNPQVKKLGASLWNLLKCPSLFETAKVFQTMSEIKQNAKLEREREDEERMKRYREKMEEGKRRKQQIKENRRAGFGLIDTILARLSPARSDESPPPTDQPATDEECRSRSKRKRGHQEQDARNGREKKRRTAPPRARSSEEPTSSGTLSPAEATSSNEDAVSTHGGISDGRPSNNRKRSRQDSNAESSGKKRRRAAPPQTGPREEPARSGGFISAGPVGSYENDTSSSSGDSCHASVVSAGETEDGYRTRSSSHSSQASGSPPNFDDSWYCFRRPGRIDYESLGWIRDYGPADKELCSREHEDAQCTEQRTSGQGGHGIKGPS